MCKGRRLPYWSKRGGTMRGLPWETGSGSVGQLVSAIMLIGANRYCDAVEETEGYLRKSNRTSTSAAVECEGSRLRNCAPGLTTGGGTLANDMLAAELGRLPHDHALRLGWTRRVSFNYDSSGRGAPKRSTARLFDHAAAFHGSCHSIRGKLERCKGLHLSRSWGSCSAQLTLHSLSSGSSSSTT
ncbi:hypothetical protein J1614_002415 [Plenodomus biglobosus]|nr:hypothetical protein J1614_002415 [Plenodomus biglobosus]